MILPIFAERGRFYGADACHLSPRPAARVSRGLCGLRRRRRRDHLTARLSDGRYPRPSGRRHEQGRQRHGHARRRAEVFPQRQGPAASRRHGGGVRAHRLGCRHGTGGPHLRADARDADARRPALRGCLSERQKRTLGGTFPPRSVPSIRRGRSCCALPSSDWCSAATTGWSARAPAPL